MILNALGVVLCLLAAPAAHADEVAQGKVAVLRALDRISGRLSDLFVPVGDSVNVGPLAVTVAQCRYPVDNPSGDAYAYLVIDDMQSRSKLFEGWMVASAPGLNPFDHMRYDVWVLRCTNS
ncbi:MAG: DUF2155 domain-containing protein [Rhodobacteraceae bacterium]|nr:DUF2155 domain-containing protein [Paracoccaceae bacterium]